MKTIWIAVLVLVVGGGGIASWLAVDASKRQAQETFFGTEKTYDTTNGQEMRPRW